MRKRDEKSGRVTDVAAQSSAVWGAPPPHEVTHGAAGAERGGAPENFGPAPRPSRSVEAARVARKTRGQKGVLQVRVKRLTGVLLAGVTTHLQPYEAIILEPTTHQMAQETGLQNTTSWPLRDRGPYLGQYRVSTTCLATLSTSMR